MYIGYMNREIKPVWGQDEPISLFSYTMCMRWTQSIVNLGSLSEVTYHICVEWWVHNQEVEELRRVSTLRMSLWTFCFILIFLIIQRIDHISHESGQFLILRMVWC